MSGFPAVRPVAAISQVTGLQGALDAALKGTAGTKTFVVAGVVQPGTDGTWNIIGDTTHADINIESVAVVSGKLRVTYSKTASKCVSLIAAPDEALAGAGFFCGVSAGTTYADITIARAAKHVFGLVQYVAGTTNAWTVNGARGNLVVTSFTSANLTLTHDSLTTARNYDISLLPRFGGATSPATAYIPVLNSMTDTTISLKFYDFAGNVVTGPDDSMRVVVGRTQGEGGVDPATMTQTTNPGSNIWILGVFEEA